MEGEKEISGVLCLPTGPTTLISHHIKACVLKDTKK